MSRQGTGPRGDLYERLGVAPGAGAEEIRRCYLELVARYHPDRHQGNPLGDLARERVAELNAAYEVLSDPARRAAYDAGYSPGSAQGTTAGGRAAAGSTGRMVARVALLAVGGLIALRWGPTLGRSVAEGVATLPGRIALAILVLSVFAFVIARARGGRSK
ncbi:MAG: J domain-containing protein [Bacteroidota bacterium]